MTSVRNEVGYILLEDCTVTITVTASASSSYLSLNNSSSSKSSWLPVNLQSSPVCPSQSHQLHLIQDSPSSWTNAADISPFSGNVSAMTTDGVRRTDASLLVGLGMEVDRGAESTGHCVDLWRLRMERLCILLNGDAEDDNDDNVVGSSIRESQGISMRASLLVTFSLPLSLSLSAGEISAPGMGIGRLRPKPLSPALQLVSSIIRCDWENLSTRMDWLEKETLNRSASHWKNQEPSVSFFPDSLDMQQLYNRIEGSARHISFDYEAVERKRCNNLPEFLALPRDVFVTFIAPFLRAKSLYSLRSTNRRLFATMKAVVPGLRLKLFQHQVASLEWMGLRERRLVNEVDVMDGQDEGCCWEERCGGDIHRAVTGGRTVLLRSRDRSTGHDKGIRFDAKYGHVMLSERDGRGSMRCARGGLLCDDPGLGKTITVLSLLLQTFGLSTDSEDTVDNLDDDGLFHKYWSSDFLTDHIRRPAIKELLSRLVKCDDSAKYFVTPIDSKFMKRFPDYLDVISEPISLMDIRKKYDTFPCKDFRTFEAAIRLCFNNAMKYNPSSDDLYKAAKRLLRSFDGLLAEFKSHQIAAGLRSISRMAKDSSAASLFHLFEERKERELHDTMVSSRSTLLVVPKPLLGHWLEQIIMHVNFNYLVEADDTGTVSPLIYYHSSKKKSNSEFFGPIVSTDLDTITRTLVFIDDGSRELPSPDVIASFPIVICSHNRFISEHRSGSVEGELRASKRRRIEGDRCQGDEGDGDIPKASPLLKVQWVRIVVDEGHTMGRQVNSLIQFTSWISAQRRWAMTGTPTQAIASAADRAVKNLFYLANFLRHDFFAQNRGREKEWNELISRGWREGSMSTFFRLRHLVSYIMVRHTKEDILTIPRPKYSLELIPLSRSETATYNTIAAAIRSNIILTTMEGKTSGWQDSLLNQHQAQHSSKALNNLRVACCGSVGMLPNVTTKTWNETLDMLRHIYHLEEAKVKVVNDFINRCATGELSSCFSCGIQLQSLFVIPCGCLVCTECIDNKTVVCPACAEGFDVDEFQRVQPGFDFLWNDLIEEEKLERERQQSLKRALRTNRGDEQEVDDDGHPIETFAKKHKGKCCRYSRKHQDGRCTICHEVHFDCNFMNDERRCQMCFKFAEECPEHASKASYFIQKLLHLRDKDLRSDTDPTAARVYIRQGIGGSNATRRPLKALVFSQFRLTYEYFGDRLIRRFGGACVADFSYTASRIEELVKFSRDPRCFVLLLSIQGSVGLDLSFVTHIFFLDSLYDKSLENQVVARAYRMGSTGAVSVEQLIAKDSVEVTINRMNSVGHDAASQLEESSNDTLVNKVKHAKVKTLLLSVRLIRSADPKKKLTENKTAQLGDDASAKLLARPPRVRFAD